MFSCDELHIAVLSLSVMPPLRRPVGSPTTSLKCCPCFQPGPHILCSCLAPIADRVEAAGSSSSSFQPNRGTSWLLLSRRCNNTCDRCSRCALVHMLLRTALILIRLLLHSMHLGLCTVTSSRLMHCLTSTSSESDSLTLATLSRPPLLAVRILLTCLPC